MALVKVFFEVYIYVGKASALFRREAMLPVIPQIGTEVYVSSSGPHTVDSVVIWAADEENKEGNILLISRRHCSDRGRKNLGAYLRQIEEDLEGWERLNETPEWTEALLSALLS
jgi:hypothetical protein